MLKSFEYFCSGGEWTQYLTLAEAVLSGGNVPAPSPGDINSVLTAIGGGMYDWRSLGDLVEAGANVHIDVNPDTSKITISAVPADVEVDHSSIVWNTEHKLSVKDAGINNSKISNNISPSKLRKSDNIGDVLTTTANGVEWGSVHDDNLFFDDLVEAAIQVNGDFKVVVKGNKTTGNPLVIAGYDESVCLFVQAGKYEDDHTIYMVDKNQLGRIIQVALLRSANIGQDFDYDKCKKVWEPGNANGRGCLPDNETIIFNDSSKLAVKISTREHNYLEKDGPYGLFVGNIPDGVIIPDLAYGVVMSSNKIFNGNQPVIEYPVDVVMLNDLDYGVTESAEEWFGGI
jgi:hypothetical protein